MLGNNSKITHEESLFTERELKPISDILKQKQDIFKIPENKIINILLQLKTIQNVPNVKNRSKFLDRAILAFKKLGKTNNFKGSVRILSKINQKFLDLHQFIIEEGSNLFTQLRRILAFIEVFIFLIDEIEDRPEFDYDDYPEIENRIISDIHIEITKNELKVGFYRDKRKYDFPLDYNQIKNNPKYDSFSRRYLIESKIMKELKKDKSINKKPKIVTKVDEKKFLCEIQLPALEFFNLFLYMEKKNIRFNVSKKNVELNVLDLYRISFIFLYIPHTRFYREGYVWVYANDIIDSIKQQDLKDKDVILIIQNDSIVIKIQSLKLKYEKKSYISSFKADKFSSENVANFSSENLAAINYDYQFSVLREFFLTTFYSKFLDKEIVCFKLQNENITIAIEDNEGRKDQTDTVWIKKDINWLKNKDGEFHCHYSGDFIKHFMDIIELAASKSMISINFAENDILNLQFNMAEPLYFPITIYLAPRIITWD